MNIEKPGSQQMEQSAYEKYQKMGGFLSEEDFQNVVMESLTTTSPDRYSMAHIKTLARERGIKLESSNGPVVLMFDAINKVVRDPEGRVIPGYPMLTDQAIFAEAMKIAGMEQNQN